MFIISDVVDILSIIILHNEVKVGCHATSGVTGSSSKSDNNCKKEAELKVLT